MQSTLKGCVAKTSGSLVEVVFVLTIARPSYFVHEPKAPFQVASFPIRHHPAVCEVVLAVSALVPPPGRDDAGAWAHGRPYDGVSMGADLCPRTGQAMPIALAPN